MGGICAACGTENPDVARFCLACGAALGGAPAAAPVRERKYATALFADLVGSTSLGEREDPEVVQSLITGTFRRLTEEIERYGGIVDKVMGDAILAIFGVPANHEDDPERAVRAALEMQAVNADLARAARGEGRVGLELRIGVEAGEVMVNIERDASLGDRMLTGDAVNTAARLQSAGVPGHVWVGPAVYASTRSVVDYRELPPLTLKGKAEAVPAWEAQGVKVRHAGERPPLGLEAHLVGRDEEMLLLKETFHRVTRERRSALVTVIGAAGVGKSRLVWEFQKYAEGLPEPVTWMKGRCLAYGNPSYSALADAVKVRCGIHEDDAPEVVHDRVAQAAAEVFGPEAAALAPHLETLVGTATAERVAAHREDLFETWRRFLERMAAAGPLVLVLEDVHWADEGLFEFVDHLAALADGPVFVLTLARPELMERRPMWGGGVRNYAAIWLEALTAEENEAMLRDLLGNALPPEVLKTVIDRAEGNPLFTEEMIRSFMDVGVLRPVGGTQRWELARPPTEMELPRSIHGLIATRIDSLPAEEKAVVQDAAVIGRIFWNGSVAELSGRDPGDVRALLSRLRVKELVVPREPSAFAGEQECGFRHALIRDVAYESVPKASRAKKHAEVARWAEGQAGGRAPEIADLLATHHAEALRYLSEMGETGPALLEARRALVRWATAAGDRADRLYELTAAVRWYRTALDLADAVDMEPAERAGLWKRLAIAGDTFLPHTEVIDAMERALAIYDALGIMAEVGPLEARLALSAVNMGRVDQAFPHIGRARGLLEPLGDSPELATALAVSGVVLSIMAQNDQAETLLRSALEMADRVDPSGELAWGFRGELGATIVNQGRGGEGLPMLEEAYEHAVGRGNTDTELRLAPLFGLALEGSDRPDHARSERVFRRAVDLALAQGIVARACWSGNNLGTLLLVTGRVAEALETLGEANERVRGLGQAGWLASLIASQANATAIAGRLDEAARLMEEWAGLDLEDWARLDPTSTLARARLASAAGDWDAVRSLVATPSINAALTPDFGESMDVLIQWARAQARGGDRAAGLPAVELFAAAAAARPLAALYHPWAAGLAEEDPSSAVERLSDAAGRFGGRGRRIGEIECLFDLAEAEDRAGSGGDATRARARTLANETGALLFVADG